MNPASIASECRAAQVMYICQEFTTALPIGPLLCESLLPTHPAASGSATRQHVVPSDRHLFIL